MPQFMPTDLLKPGKVDQRSLDPEQKFAWAESQIRRVALGKAESIGCPYCLSSIVIGVDRLCCPSMGEATASVLQSMEADGLYEKECLGVLASALPSVAEADEAKGSSVGNNSTQVIQ